VRTLNRSAGASAVPSLDLLSDLTTLLEGDQALYICLEYRGAVMTVKSPDMVAFGETLITEWARLSPEDRARKVMEWIRRAAAYCQSPQIRWMPPENSESPPGRRSA